MCAACCLRFLILLFWPLLIIPVSLEAVATEILDFFLQDSGFGPLTFFLFCFFVAAIDDSAFPSDSDTDFLCLVGCTFFTPIYVYEI